MKLLSLELQAFGCFTGTRLDFPEDGPVFHIIHGENEAGKSTALRGLTQFFFEIPAGTADDFLHPAPRLRLRAALRHADGRTLEAVRRKGHKATLETPEGEPLAESVLAEFTGHVSQQTFERVYRLDHETLVRGGADLLRGEGDLAESLFEAGAGVMGLRAIQQALEEEADAIYRPRASKPPLNVQLAAYKSAVKRTKDSSLKPAAWDERQHQRDALRRALVEARATAEAHQTELRRYERLLAAREPAAALRLVREELQTLQVAVELPEEAPKVRGEIVQRRQAAEEALARAGERLQNWARELAALKASPALLQEEPAILALQQRLETYERVRADLPGVELEGKRAAAEAAELWGDLRMSQAPELSGRELERIDALSAQHTLLEERARKAADRLREGEEQLAALEARLPSAMTEGAGPLRLLLVRAQKEGDLESAAELAGRRALQGREKALRAVRRLAHFHGSPEELELLALPAEEAIDRFERELGEAAQEEAVQERRAVEARASWRQAETQLRALPGREALPSEQELIARRARREEGWRRVRVAWQQRREDDGGYHAQKALPEAYEEAVTEADEMADRLRHEAERVAQAAVLTEAEATARGEAAEQEAALERNRKGRAEREQKWQELWQPAGIVPSPPREMRAWLGSCAEARRSLEEARMAAEAAAEKEQARERYAAELRLALGKAEAEAEGLSALIDRATVLTEELAEVERQRAETGKHRRVSEAAAQALRMWESEWAEAVAGLGLAKTPGAREAQALLRQMEKAVETQKQAGLLEARLVQMQQARSDFEQEAARLVRAAAPELAEESAATATRRLQTQLTAAQKAATQQEALRVRVAEDTEAMGEAKRSLGRAEEDLRALLAAARCTTAEELLQAETKSARRHALAREERELTLTLTRLNSSPLPLEDFVRELQGQDADKMVVAQGRIEELARAAEGQKEEVLRALLSCEAELETMDGGDTAAQAEAEARQAAAEIETLSARYLRLRLAREILQRQIDRYRDENEGPVLRRAHELFPRLTHGSFRGLRTGFDAKGRPVLLGVRDGGEEVPVAGMSEGTRDQLFLALRLASLELQMQGCEPVPLVLDDILISFDDQRASDSLAVLAEFCTKTQVLLFTHHAHVVELARQVVPGHLLQVHRLERGRPGPGRASEI